MPPSVQIIPLTRIVNIWAELIKRMESVAVVMTIT
jgi:hypothetical protein